jgi:iron-sulfur cluster assembly protein
VRKRTVKEAAMGLAYGRWLFHELLRFLKDDEWIVRNQRVCIEGLKRNQTKANQTMIEITDTAVEQLRALLDERGAAQSEGQGLGLRLQVQRGGCAGMQYEMKVDEAVEGDVVSWKQGVSVIIDPESLKFLDGSIVDYEDGLNDSGFKIRNPNAARSCGCGTSFEPAEMAATS